MQPYVLVQLLIPVSVWLLDIYICLYFGLQLNVPDSLDIIRSSREARERTLCIQREIFSSRLGAITGISEHALDHHISWP